MVIRALQVVAQMAGGNTEVAGWANGVVEKERGRIQNALTYLHYICDALEQGGFTRRCAGDAPVVAASLPCLSGRSGVSDYRQRQRNLVKLRLYERHLCRKFLAIGRILCWHARGKCQQTNCQHFVTWRLLHCDLAKIICVR